MENIRRREWPIENTRNAMQERIVSQFILQNYCPLYVQILDNSGQYRYTRTKVGTNYVVSLRCDSESRRLVLRKSAFVFDEEAETELHDNLVKAYGPIYERTGISLREIKQCIKLEIEAIKSKQQFLSQ